MVYVAVAVDTVPPGTSSKIGSVIPASSLVVSSLPGSLSAFSGAAVHTSFVPIESTPAATQLAVILLSRETSQSEPKLAALSSSSPNPTVARLASSTPMVPFFLDHQLVLT